jgi:hypothetical protein
MAPESPGLERNSLHQRGLRERPREKRAHRIASTTASASLDSTASTRAIWGSKTSGFEEAALDSALGDRYREYAARTPRRLVPGCGRRGGGADLRDDQRAVHAALPVTLR